MGSERRQHQRLKTNDMAGHVRVRQEVLALGLPIDNISLGGLFVRCEAPLPTWTQVVLELVQPELQSPLKVTGTVVLSLDKEKARAVRATPGMGVRFDPLPEDATRRLQSLLSALASDRALCSPGAHNPTEIGEAVQASRTAFDFGFGSLDGYGEEGPPAFFAPPKSWAEAIPETPPAALEPVRPQPPDLAPPAVPRPAAPEAVPPVPPAPAPASRDEVTAQPAAASIGGAPIEVMQGARLMVQVRGLLQELDETRLELEGRGNEVLRLREENERLQAELKKRDARILELELKLAQH